MKCRTSDDELIVIVKNNSSLAGCLRDMTLAVKGANYSTLKRRIVKLGIDISHFTGQGHKKGYNRRKLSNEELFIENSTSITAVVRNRILKDNLLPYECSEPKCKLKEWLNKDISLHLDHVNGIDNDHRLENLRFLCPNCHSQTDTYCGKNKRLKNIQNGNITTKEDIKEAIRKVNFKNKCLNCDALVYKDSVRCRKCSDKIPKGFISIHPEITKEKVSHFLDKLKEGMNYTKIGLAFEVSRPTARKIISFAPFFELCSQQQLDELKSKFCKRDYSK